MPSSGFQTCALDRKSTRLNSSHTIISYAVFCLKKKKLNEVPLLLGDASTHGRGVQAKAAARRWRASWCTLMALSRCAPLLPMLSFFFLNDPGPTEIYTLSLPAALPI